jgi:hypothetical protein
MLESCGVAAFIDRCVLKITHKSSKVFAYLNSCTLSKELCATIKVTGAVIVMPCQVVIC